MRRQGESGRAEPAGFEPPRTTTLFAALEVAAAHPRRQLHVVVDNYATHKHPAVRAWLTRHRRMRLHFTPISGSWLNLVEVFDLHPPGAAPRPLSHRRRPRPRHPALHRRLDDRCQVFTWTKAPDTVIAKATDPRHRKTPSASVTDHHVPAFARPPRWVGSSRNASMRVTTR